MSTGSHSVSQSSDASPPCSAEQTSPLHHLLNMCFIFFILFHLFIYLLFLLHSLLFYIHHVLYYVTHIKPFQASLTVPLVLWILKALFLFFLFNCCCYQTCVYEALFPSRSVFLFIVSSLLLCNWCERGLKLGDCLQFHCFHLEFEFKMTPQLVCKQTSHSQTRRGLRFQRNRRHLVRFKKKKKGGREDRFVPGFVINKS